MVQKNDSIPPLNPSTTIYYKLRRERDEAAVVESLIQFMVSFYDRSVLYPVFDRLWSEVKDSPSLHTGIDRALTKRPVESDLGSRMIWDLLQGVSEDELIGVVGDTGEGDTGTHVVPLALAFKSMSLVEIGRIEEADKTCEELGEKLGTLQGGLKAGVESQTRCGESNRDDGPWRNGGRHGRVSFGIRFVPGNPSSSCWLHGQTCNQFCRGRRIRARTCRNPFKRSHQSTSPRAR